MESNGVDNAVSPENKEEFIRRQKTESMSDKMAEEDMVANNCQSEKGSDDQQQQLNSPVQANTSVNGDDNASSEDAGLQQQLATLPTSSNKLLTKQHPLKSKWTFWFLNNKKELDWLERLSKVCTVSTIEEFWAFFDNIRPPSGMYGCDYNFFREDIQPLWEVKENKEGGRLVVQVDKQKNDLLDHWWLELLLACIGEHFGDVSDQVCGAVCNIRQKGSKISIWTTNAMEEEKNKRIGQLIKERFQEIPGANVKPFLKVNFEDHLMVQQKTSSAIPSRFTI